MALPPNLDQDKLSEVALAVLGLTAFRDHDIVRAWKGMDWDLLDVLYQQGWIADPKGKAKSVVLQWCSACSRLAGQALSEMSRIEAMLSSPAPSSLSQCSPTSRRRASLGPFGRWP